MSRQVTCLECYVSANGGNIGCEKCNGEGVVEIGDGLCPQELAAIELERVKKEIVKPYYERREKVINDLLIMFGGTHNFQDPISGVVFRIDKLEYRSVSLFPYEIQRTRLADENKGSVSQKDAELMGYRFRVPGTFDDDTRLPEEIPYLKPGSDNKPETIGGVRI